MNYWNILGIEKTSDIRTIKRAYAVKLKKTKPDEDPDGFKKLHAAYKWAVDFAKNNSVHSEYVGPESFNEKKTQVTEFDNEVLQSGSIETTQQIENISEEDINNTKEDDEYFAYLQEQWDKLTGQVDKITDSIDSINTPESWLFLENIDILFDLQFKSEFSHYIFGSIIDCLDQFTAEKRVSKEIFDYLDHIFYWSDRRDYLEDEYGFESVEKVFYAATEIEEIKFKWIVPVYHKGKMEYAGYYSRLFATMFDWFVLTYLLIFLKKINIDPFSLESENSFPAIVYAIILYVVVSSILEATPLQGTFGKILFGMKVVSSKGKRLNIFQSFFRGILYSINIIGFKITVWINLFLNDDRLLHDRTSGSIVVKR